MHVACALLGLAVIGVSLPEKPPCPGWKAGEVRRVTPAGIFDYMDGGGELYLSYGFKELLVREYTRPGEPKITCELYLMPTSADAYGLYSQDRTGKQLKIGQGAVYGSGLLIVWQGKCFIRILADRETPGAKTCATALAKQIAASCGPAGRPPAELAWLPARGLDKLSVHYFHTQMVLNYFHFVSTQNLLNLSARTNAVMGAYSGKTGKSLALIVGYPSAAAASSAWTKFRKGYMAGLKPEGEFSVARQEDGKWVAGNVKGRKLRIVLESPTREDCLRLIRSLSGG